MATRVITIHVDDLDGTELAEGEGETITFSLDGVDYEIDLSSTNAKQLRDEFAKYVSAARASRGKLRTAAPSHKPSHRVELAEAREWLRAQGHPVADRGRIAASLMDLYRDR